MYHDQRFTLLHPAVYLSFLHSVVHASVVSSRSDTRYPSSSGRFFRGLAHTPARINTNAAEVGYRADTPSGRREHPRKRLWRNRGSGVARPPSSLLFFSQQQSFGGRPLAEERITSEPRGEKVCRLAIRRSTTRPNRTHPSGKVPCERACALLFFSLPPPLVSFFFRFSYSSRPVSRFKYFGAAPTTVPIPVEHEREHRRSLCRLCFSLAIKLMRCFSLDFCVPFILSLSLSFCSVFCRPFCKLVSRLRAEGGAAYSNTRDTLNTLSGEHVSSICWELFRRNRPLCHGNSPVWSEHYRLP